jgi:cyclophilin family peptidyl-prolyl cis-trans isomerase
VVAAALTGLYGTTSDPDSTTVAAARRLISHPDAVVRSLAADVLAGTHDPGDLPALVCAFRRAGADSIPDAALSALAALHALAELSETVRDRLGKDFIDSTPRPSEFLLRRWAAEHWPDLARRWEPLLPVGTGRDPAYYQSLARRFLWDPKQAYPRVLIVTGRADSIVVELFGPDAPVTVDHFLGLVQRRFFDGRHWHRVVPNFVVQDGDPRGDGWGGPGPAIRDEINPQRYDAFVVGMALSGPDTGGSQWFITLSPQPHLDGTYTVFGRVVSGIPALLRITQGDPITSIRLLGPHRVQLGRQTNGRPSGGNY